MDAPAAVARIRAVPCHCRCLGPRFCPGSEAREARNAPGACGSPRRCLVRPRWALALAAAAAATAPVRADRQLGEVTLNRLGPGLLERDAAGDVVLSPKEPYHAVVGVGRAKFVRYSCSGNPSDAVIFLSTLVNDADPLLIVSENPDAPPSLASHHASSVHQWREDVEGRRWLVVRNIGPRGGILGIVNMRHFATSALDAVLQVRCATVIAFDSLFWSHLHTSHICPTGALPLEPGNAPSGSLFCSGHGVCEHFDLCVCDRGYLGEACEHHTTDLVVNSSGRYRFPLAGGSYEYYRVRVPKSFPGGYLQVESISDTPLVILVQNDVLPSKGQFELSNFHDWVNHRTLSTLKFKVNSGQKSRVRDLGWAGGPRCPELLGLAPLGDQPPCGHDHLGLCTAACQNCFECDSGHSCGAACGLCKSHDCTTRLRACAGSVPCDGAVAQTCENDCDGCGDCAEKNDAECHRCTCCTPCMPIVAKCTRFDWPSSSVVYVGILNHRRYFNDSATALADISIALRADPDFVPDAASELAALYDPFRDFASIERTQRPAYEDSERLLFHVLLAAPQKGGPVYESLTLNVRRDHITLLHLTGEALNFGGRVAVSFAADAAVAHVLTASRAAPRTLFDFDGAPPWALEDGRRSFLLEASGQASIWCAFFGLADTVVAVQLRAVHPVGRASQAAPSLAASHPLASHCAIALSHFGALLAPFAFALVLVAIAAEARRRALGLSEEGTAAGPRGGLLSTTADDELLSAAPPGWHPNRGGIGDDGL